MDHILLSQIRDSPNLEGQVPVFISPRNRVAQLYPQALGSVFVASYDLQGYGGGIRPILNIVCFERVPNTSGPTEERTQSVTSRRVWPEQRSKENKTVTPQRQEKAIAGQQR
jgi:hypothetical protein